MAAALEGRTVLEECRGATRLRGSPVRTTWWEQDLTLPPEPEEDEGDVAPGREAIGASWEGRSSAPDHPTAQQQRDARRAEWEARDLAAEEEQDRRWAEAHLPSDLI